MDIFRGILKLEENKMKLGTILTLALIGLLVIGGVIAELATTKVTINKDVNVDAKIADLATLDKSRDIGSEIADKGVIAWQQQELNKAVMPLRQAVNKAIATKDIEVINKATDCINAGLPKE